MVNQTSKNQSSSKLMTSGTPRFYNQVPVKIKDLTEDPLKNKKEIAGQPFTLQCRLGLITQEPSAAPNTAFPLRFTRALITAFLEASPQVLS